MNKNVATLEHFAPATYRFYRHALEILQAARIPFLVGGAYAFDYYTGIARHTKDLDIFLRGDHLLSALDAFQGAGYHCQILFSHWLGKVYFEEDFVDIIFNSGNGKCSVDDDWFEHAIEAETVGMNAGIVPVEEMIWQKAFIMERERFDGADILHLIRARGSVLDWDRLLAKFGPHWRVLLSHLVLFSYVYPADRQSIPDRVMKQLFDYIRDPSVVDDSTLCYGTFLSRTQYLPDIEEWGYSDPRLAPIGAMSAEQVEQWTNAGR